MLAPTATPNKMKKVSIGIALCRRHPETQVPQVLLVKSRITYSYNEFVFGKYKFGDNETLQHMFNGMVVNEKHLLLSHDFNKIWYHIWLRVPSADVNDSMYQFYTGCRNKYERFISKDGGKRLSSLIQKSRSPGDTGWGIPRGRPNPDEKEIDCGLRELWEEANVMSKSVNLLGVDPIVSSYNTPTCIYTCRFYVGHTNDDIAEGVNFSNPQQAKEIGDTKWVELQQISGMICQSHDLKKQVAAALRIFKSKTKPAAG